MTMEDGDWALVARRNGSVLSSSHFLVLSNQQPLGRTQFLECLKQSCGCSSLNATCDDCQRIITWAASWLSRSGVLKFAALETDALVLWVRKAKLVGRPESTIDNSHATTLEIGFEEMPSTWNGPYSVRPNDTIRFVVPTSVVPGDTPPPPPLEFQLLSVGRTSGLAEIRADNNKEWFPVDAEPTTNLDAVLRSTQLDDELRPPETKISDTTSDEKRKDTARTEIDRATGKTDTISKSKDNDSASSHPFRLYFVPLGSDMHKSLLYGDADGKMVGLATHARRRGAVVVERFHKDQQPPYPTHLVLSDRPLSSNQIIAHKLGFADTDALRDFLSKHDIQCVYRKWVSSGDPDHFQALQPPTMKDLYHSLQATTRKRKRNDDEANGAGAAKRVKSDAGQLIERNVELSDLFKKLSKMYRAAPLTPMDDRKSYMFDLIHGRLRHLPFEITDDPDVLRRVRNVKGIGDSSLQFIKEYLERGSCTRLEEFERDPMRKAMLAIKKIWGIGRERALQLVRKGYKDIESIRRALEDGTLKLERNQLIGVRHYEDFQEKMDRSEAEAIGEIVFAAVRARFPSAELTLMGSFRRGKPSCGDVDILITHPDYEKAVPPRALGKIVDDLRASGAVEHHLTFIPGMNPNRYESLDASESKKLLNPQTLVHTSEKKPSKNSNSSMWMGVLKSPTVANKYRRVDIKFYPNAEKVFAGLHFTGNGHFNRSMRLWAEMKYGWKMSDKGMIDIASSVPVFKTPPQSEREVFERLGICWKGLTERDCFDAVQSADEPGTTAASLLDGFSDSDLQAREANVQWVN